MARLQAFFGKKIGPTRAYDESGRSIVVTDILVPDAVIVQVKSTDKDGYQAVQAGFDYRKNKNTNKPMQGHLKKTGHGTTNTPRFLRELALVEGEGEFKPGDAIKATDIFAVGDKVTITSLSKGKGFQGGVKRHGFAGGPRTHGQSDRERAPGSIGQTTTPGRVYKGKRMAGHTGMEVVTIHRMKIVNLDAEKHIMRVKGLIAGNRTVPVEIKK